MLHVRKLVQNVFFGWWIVGSVATVQFLLAALIFQAYSTYAALWRAEFGWSATSLALAYSLHRAESGLLGPVQGWLLQRLGIRLVMRFGVVLLAVGFMLLSRIDSLLSFYLTFALMAVGGSLMGILSLMSVLVNWFERKRATALALMHTGTSLGGLATPLVAEAMLVLGWRSVAFTSGVIILIVGFAATQLMHPSPEAVGMRPDGAPPPGRRGSEGGEEDEPVQVQREYTAGEALRTRSFWLLSLGHASGVMIVSALLVHLVVHLNEGLGYSIRLAATVVALMTAMTLAGQLLGGFVGDRYDKRILAMLAMVGHATGILALAYGTNPILVGYFVIAHGLAWGLRGPLMGSLRADYFGRSSFPTIMGLSSMIVMGGSIGGPVLAGILSDTLGDYRWAFIVLAALGMLGTLFFAFAHKPADTSGD